MTRIDITRAITAHVLWKARLTAAIQHGESEFSPDFVRADDQCELGKWLNGPLPSTLTSSSHYRKSLELHREFHEVAGTVLSFALNGQRIEALRALERDGEFTRASSLLISELKALNAEGTE